MNHGVSHHVVTATGLATAAAEAAPHLRPILFAASQGLVAFGHVTPHSGLFRFPRTRPVVLIVGDDYDLSFGPSAFHAKSLRRFLRSAGAAVIVSGAPDPRAYLAALAGPISTGRDVAIIETREAHEPAWIALARESHPGIALLLSTPGRGREGLQ